MINLQYGRCYLYKDCTPEQAEEIYSQIRKKNILFYDFENDKWTDNGKIKNNSLVKLKEYVWSCKI